MGSVKSTCKKFARKKEKKKSIIIQIITKNIYNNIKLQIINLPKYTCFPQSLRIIYHIQHK